MSEEKPNLPATITVAGSSLAAFDLVRRMMFLLVEKGLISRQEMCSEVRAAYDKNQEIAHDTGASANANAAALLRMAILELGCPNPPDQE